MRMASVLGFAIFILAAGILVSGARAAVLDDGRATSQTTSSDTTGVPDKYAAPFSSSGPYLPVAAASIRGH